jgi:hypothetical protein
VTLKIGKPSVPGPQLGNEAKIYCKLAPRVTSKRERQSFFVGPRFIPTCAGIRAGGGKLRPYDGLTSNMRTKAPAC